MRGYQLICLSLVGALTALAANPLPAQAPAAAPPEFSPQEQQARQAILTGADWQAARSSLDKWLSVQGAYTPEQIAQMKTNFAALIDSMSADELQGFLVDMQQRLEILLSPEVNAARRWADELYTPQGKRNLLEKGHIADPMSLSGEELAKALIEFAQDRQSRASSQAVFEQGQAVQAAATRQLFKEQQAAAAAAAAAPPQMTSASTSYAPRRDRGQQRYERPDRATYEGAPDRASYETPYRGPRDAPRYEAPYRPLHYGIGPWGGIWRAY